MPKIENKWDSLYDPGKQTWFTKLEEKAINWYFSRMVGIAILSASGVKSGKIFEPGCKFTIGDLFNLPFPDEEFDVVFNQGVMEHFKIAGINPDVGIQEMLRVVKKDGTLVILVPAFFSPLFFIHRFFKSFNLIEKYWPYEDQEFLHKHELYEMMKSGGCKNIVVRRVWKSFFFSLIGYCKKTD